jgi:hypothetical protein
VDRQIVELGIEHDGRNDDLRLPHGAPTRWPHGWKVTRQGEPVPPEVPPYPVTCPRTGWRVPMVETFQVHAPTKTIVELVPDEKSRSYTLAPRRSVSDQEWQEAARGTVVRQDGEFWLCHPRPTPVSQAGARASAGGGTRVRIANRAKAYLYCLETRCPKSGWMVPMAPSWVISKNYRTVARLVPDPANRRFQI